MGVNPLDLSRVEKIPKCRGGGIPVWWHKNAFDFSTKVVGLKLQLSSPNAIRISIIHVDKLKAYPGMSGWRLDYAIYRNEEWFVKGRIELTTDELRSAFGIINVTDQKSEWLLERYGGSSASVGKWIRWQYFLNLPGPGTGEDGDANVSVNAGVCVREAVNAFIQKHDKRL
jgi:hypothetical protein